MNIIEAGKLMEEGERTRRSLFEPETYLHAPDGCNIEWENGDIYTPDVVDITANDWEVI